MAAGARTTARFTREQVRFIVTTPGLDDAINLQIRQAAATMSPVTLRARPHEDLITAVGRHAVALASHADGEPAKAYRMLEAIIDALAPTAARDTF